MNHFIKVNTYEIQIILYWILGNVLLDRGIMFWGWSSIVWGWITFFYTIAYSAKYSNEIKNAFK